MQRLFFVALAAVVAGGCYSSGLKIAERGRPAAYSVVLPEKPSPSEPVVISTPGVPFISGWP